MHREEIGFTLVEIAISTVLFAIIIVVVYSSFSLGARIWRDKLLDLPSLQPIRIGLLKIEKEIKSAFLYSGIHFQGTAEQISFPLIITKGGIPKIHTVTYSIEKDEDLATFKLLRKEIEFKPGAESQSEESTKTKTVLSGLDSLSFDYAYKSTEPGVPYDWKGEFDGTNLRKIPNGIKVSFTLKKENFDKIISIPQGELISE